jgi:hypothetical protein
MMRRQSKLRDRFFVQDKKDAHKDSKTTYAAQKIKDPRKTPFPIDIDHPVSLENPEKRRNPPFPCSERNRKTLLLLSREITKYYTSVQDYPPHSIQHLPFHPLHYHRPAAPVNQPKVKTVTPTMENKKAYVCFSIKLIALLQVAHT